jgi:hypothetical protein
MLVLLHSVVRRIIPTSAVGFLYTSIAVSHLLSEFRAITGELRMVVNKTEVLHLTEMVK